MKVIMVAGVAATLAAAPAVTSSQSFLHKCTDASSGDIQYASEKKPGMECEAIGATTTPRWIQVATSADGSTLVRVDKETITRDGDGIVSAWVQYFYLKSRRYVNGGYVARTMQRESMNCAHMSISAKSFVSYGENEVALDSATYLTGTLPSPVVPDSINEAVWSYLCKP